jgi:predicted DsbA family dithiol-disulfide isomerase
MESNKIHIWSDIACPFCYIGKARLMRALGEDRPVVWHSFILQPNQITEPQSTLAHYLSKTKGWTLEQTQQIQNQVATSAATDGLIMNMDRVIPANTTRAHLLMQFCRREPFLSDLIQELFLSYFTLGLNIDDLNTLRTVYKKVSSIDLPLTDQMLFSQQDLLNEDLQLAGQFGIRAVPYFIFDPAFSLSGAQEARVFEQAVAEWRQGLS